MMSSRLQRFVFMVMKFWSKSVTLTEVLGELGPWQLKCITQKDSEKAPWEDQAPEPRPHHCCTYLLGLLNHYELRTRRFSFQPSQPPGHLTSGRTVYLAIRSPFATSGCVFQLISCDPVERGPRKRKLSLKQSWVTFLVLPRFKSWSGAPSDFPVLIWRYFLPSIPIFQKQPDKVIGLHAGSTLLFGGIKVQPCVLNI